MIKVQNICKTYKVAKRNKGLKEAAKALFKRDYEYIKALNVNRINVTCIGG